MESIDIRDGEPEDAGSAARLEREAGSRLMDFLAGFSGRQATERLLAALWEKSGTRFSREYGRVARIEGRTAGFLVGYPENLIAGLDLKTGRALLALQGWRFILRALRHPLVTVRMSSMPEAESGDWYVCVLATEAAFRGRGIGTALLGDAEIRARTAGAKSLSLMVAERNDAARALYDRFGFRERGRFTIAGRTSIRLAKPL